MVPNRTEKFEKSEWRKSVFWTDFADVMSIMLNDYVAAKDLKPVVPSWFRQERYHYCEHMNGSASAKRSIFARRSGKKQSK